MPGEDGSGIYQDARGYATVVPGQNPQITVYQLVISTRRTAQLGADSTGTCSSLGLDQPARRERQFSYERLTACCPVP